MATDCELCGRNVDSPVRAKVEGVILDELCSNCASKGEILGDKKHIAAFSRPVRAIAAAEDIVADYGHLLRTAREKRNLTLETLARNIFEKESEIKRIEEGKLKPSLQQAKKLEKELEIVLVEKSGGSENGSIGDQGTNETKGQTDDRLTLGHFLKVRKKN